MSEPFETNPGKAFHNLVGKLVVSDETWQSFLVDPEQVFAKHGVGMSEQEVVALRKGIADVIRAERHKGDKYEVLRLILEHASDALAHASGKEPSASAIMTVEEELRRWREDQD